MKYEYKLEIELDNQHEVDDLAECIYEAADNHLYNTGNMAHFRLAVTGVDVNGKGIDALLGKIIMGLSGPYRIVEDSKTSVQVIDSGHVYEINVRQVK